ncbi:MAG: tetratricopeptide repeat protein [Candidatus Eisenbacteria bacterium]
MLDLSARDRGIFLAVVAVALVIRVAYLIDVRDSPYAKEPLLDSYWYDDKANAVVEGDLLSRGGSFRVPLYTYFLAGCYLIFGRSLAPPAIIQVILGALTCGLVYVIGKRIFGRLAGAFAGFGLAVYRMAIYSDAEILPTTLFILFIVAAVYYLLNLFERERVRDSLLAGLFLGLALLTRPEVLIYAAALGLVVLTLKGKRGFRLVAGMGIVLVMMTVCLGLRNLAAFGEFYLFSPQGAVNLYIGNGRFADGRSVLAPPTRFPYAVTADPSEDAMIVACKQAALEDVGRELSDRELSTYYTHRTLAEVGGDFSRWLGLMVRKTYYFLNSYESSDIKLIPRFIERYSRVLGLPLVGYMVAMPLGLVGLTLAAARRIRAAWLVSAAFLGCAVITVMFFVVWRFRLPAVPFLLILGGYTVSELVRLGRSRTWRPFLLILGCVVALGLFSATNFWGIKTESQAATYIANEGALLLHEGKAEQAIEVYKEAIAADPKDATPYYYLGKAYALAGLIPQAKAALEKAAAVNPNFRPFALLSVGILAVKQGDFAAASGYFKQAVAADPTFARGYYNLGACLFNLRRYAEAEEALYQAERLAKGDSEVIISSAGILMDMGKIERGVAMAQSVLAREPRNGRAYFTLGLALERQGRLAEAVVQYETALKYMPDAADARQKVIDLRARLLKR